MSAIESFENDAKEVLKDLRKSPTFAMSLGAKELFHTNFLSFLLETDLEPLKQISKRLKQELFGDDFDGAVWAFRESKNMDLIVVPKDPELQPQYSIVVIEAKMKSIPTKKQLEGYDEKIIGVMQDHKINRKHHFNIGEVDPNNSVKIQNGNKLAFDYVRLIGGDTVQYRVFDENRSDGQNHKYVSGFPREVRRIILAASSPYSTKEPMTSSKKWEYWSWAKICTLLKSADDSDPLVQLVGKYADDLSHLVSLLRSTEILVENFCAEGTNINFKAFDKSLLDPFKSARIHDLISKYAYWCLSQKLQGQLANQSGGFSFDVYFSRGTPILEVTKPLESLDHKREIGVQIQGGQYRHFILSRKPDERLAEFVGGYLRWFNIVDDGIQNAGDLNKFDDKKFLYSKKKMEQLTFTELCNELRNSLQKCPCKS